MMRCNRPRILEEYNTLSMKLANPSLSSDEMNGAGTIRNRHGTTDDQLCVRRLFQILPAMELYDRLHAYRFGLGKGPIDAQRLGHTSSKLVTLYTLSHMLGASFGIACQVAG
jgi:hypothetical protein